MAGSATLGRSYQSTVSLGTVGERRETSIESSCCSDSWEESGSDGGEEDEKRSERAWRKQWRKRLTTWGKGIKDRVEFAENGELIYIKFLT